MFSENFSFLLWNACTLNAPRQDEIELKCVEKKFDVVCICEANLKKPMNRCRNYYKFSYGTMMIMVKEDVECRILHDWCFGTQDYEILCFDFGRMVLICAYLRDGRKLVGVKKLMEVYDEVNRSCSKVCIIGDLNAKMKIVRPQQVMNNAGRWLQLYLEEQNDDLTVHNSSAYTFKRPNTRASVLDLCLTSGDLCSDVNVVEVKDWFDSDHRPLVIEFGSTMKKKINDNYAAVYPIRACNLVGKTFDEDFAKDLTRLLLEVPHLLFDDGEMLWMEVRKCIIDCCRKHGLLRRASRSNGKIWMTDELLEKIQARNDAKTTNLILYRQLKAEVQRDIRREKRHSFVKFANSITHADTEKQVWNKFKMSRGADRVFKSVGDGEREVEAVAESFRSFSRPEIPQIPQVESEFERTCFFNQHVCDVDNDPLNRRISLGEVRTAVFQSRSSSNPGPDGIPYKLFQCGSEHLKVVLCSMFNLWFQSGKIPRSCEEGIQVAIPKREAGAFRPITMKNAVVKLFERVLYNRMYQFCDGFIPDYQFGFRHERGASDQLVRVLNHLEQKKKAKQYSLVLFLDIKKAYDRVYRKALMNKLFKLGIKGKMWNIINMMMHHGRYRTLLNNFVSEEYILEEGIPQGGIMSSLLWNLFFADIPTATDEVPGFYGAFADDLAIITSDERKSAATLRMTRLYARLRAWAVRNRVEFNDSKVKLMIVAPRKRRRPGLHLYPELRVSYTDLDGNPQVVEHVECYNYLGAKLDQKLNLRRWIDRIVLEIRKRIAFIRRIVKTMMIPRAVIERLYNGYIRGYINYGCQVWSMKKYSKKVEIEDRKGMRLCCGLLLRTRTEEVDEETSIERLRPLMRRHTVRFIGRKLTGSVESMKQLVLAARGGRARGSTCEQMVQVWIDEHLPDFGVIQTKEFEEVAEMIEQQLLRPLKKMSKYHGDFWKERMLARIRVGVLPTRSWARSMRLARHDDCRHCKNEEETLEHLFEGGCPKLISDELGLLNEASIYELRTILKYSNDDQEVRRVEEA